MVVLALWLENRSTTDHNIVQSSSQLLQVLTGILNLAYNEISIDQLPIGTVGILVK